MKCVIRGSTLAGHEEQAQNTGWVILNRNNIDELVQQFRDLLPEDLRRTRDDIEKNMTAALNATLSRMNLVTREEFEVQQELLVRTRTLLDELDRRVRELETKLDSDSKE